VVAFRRKKKLILAEGYHGAMLITFRTAWSKCFAAEEPVVLGAHSGVANSNRQDLFRGPVTNSLVSPIRSKEEAQNGYFAGLTLAAIEFNCEKADYYRQYWRS
jgi:hypothetical protein